MAAAKVRRVLNFALFLFICVQSTHAQGSYQIPDVRIQALRPKGFRASIPDSPNTSVFVFQGNINRKIDSNGVGTLSGEILEPTAGRWVFEDPNVELKVGDVINYHVFVSNNGAGYIKDNGSYNVTALEDLSTTAKPECRPTLTTILVGTVCSGETIFEDDFDSLKENKWQIEQYVPQEQPDYPFVSYQRSSVTVKDGKLHILPSLQQNLPGFSNESIVSGNLSLYDGCTGPAETCYYIPSGPDILPPVASGKITSKAFAFTYGTIELRAKLPKGDWLYPEILLEPLMKRYGSIHQTSGIMKIVSARGNEELYIGPSNYGNTLLYGGAVIDSRCYDALLTSKIGSSPWGDDFHVYSMRWAPERITISVDGVEWARIEPAASGLRGKLPPTCRTEPLSIVPTSSMAPFDSHFYLTLGVAAGGITEFRDGLYTQGGRPKPWVNTNSKAKLNFWRDSSAWYSTWREPELIVDYIKVKAL